MEAAPEDPSQKNVDVRCTCCPHGYHICLDFLKYLDCMKQDDLNKMNGGTFGTKFHKKEFHTEQNKEIYDKEVKVVFLDQATDSNAQLRLRVPTQRAPQKSEKHDNKPAEPTPSSSNVHVHKELIRTVYLPDLEEKKKPTTRDVGLLCKAQTRDVGVTYHHELEKPTTKNIAVGVGEIGVDIEGECGGLVDAGTHITNMAMQQMNMAAFYNRDIHVSKEQLMQLLDMMLKKEVRSVGVQCDASVACGSDAADDSTAERNDRSSDPVVGTEQFMRVK